jgi:hypothetical protein
MSDFLTNLAARTIAAPSLRPRTRMRFEPAADEPPQMIAADAAPPHEASAAIVVPVAANSSRAPMRAEATPPTPSIEHHSPRTPERVPPQRPVQQAVPLRQPQTSSDPASAPDQKPERHDETLIETHIVREAVPEVRVVREETASEPVRETSLIRERVRVPERIVEQRIDKTVERIIETREVPVIEPISTETAAPKQNKPHRYDEQPPRLVREEVPREMRNRVQADKSSERVGDRVIVRRETGPRPPAATSRRTAIPRDTRQSTPATSEPVVHVSIGRVEVRAVAPTPQPRLAPRRNTPMTIDEYVAKRKERP